MLASKGFIRAGDGTITKRQGRRVIVKSQGIEIIRAGYGCKKDF